MTRVWELKEWRESERGHRRGAISQKKKLFSLSCVDREVSFSLLCIFNSRSPKWKIHVFLPRSPCNGWKLFKCLRDMPWNQERYTWRKRAAGETLRWIKKNNKNILLAAYFGIKLFVQRAPIDSHKTIVVALRFF